MQAIYPGEYSDDEASLLKFSFSESKYEDNESAIESVLGEDHFDLVLTMKQIYDWSILSSIMNDDEGKTYTFISRAKVDLYSKHHSQLAVFKKLLRKYGENGEYNHMFRTMEDNTYSAYVGSLNYKGKKSRRGAKANDFYKEAEKILKKINEKNGPLPECEELLMAISNDSFLPKLLTTANGVVPNQIYAAELTKILENASSYLPFLTEKDESGLTNAKKIHEMFTFHIPYYVGPLKKAEGSNAWVVRKESGVVYPWNIEEKVDMAKTSEAFILNLIRKCTYLNDESVMPENSLLNEKYRVLNELNNLKVNGQKISVELKQDLFNELFRSTGKKVTTKKLLTELKKRGILRQDEEEECLEGYDKAQGGFVNTLSSYHKFAEIFGVDVLTDTQIEVAERAIYYATVYGDDRKRLKAVIDEKITDDEMNPKQKNRLIGLRFTGWSRFSREFLLLKEAEKSTGEVVTIISCLWNSNDNLMQIINSDKYTFKKTIEERTKKMEKNLSEVAFEDIEDSYMSAPVRRTVWQAIRILQEIREVMGKEPKRVFVEMARYDGKKGSEGRKNSRKAALIDLYKKCKADDKDFLSEISTRDERDFRIKKLYLYYRQKGICMYSGHQIEINKLFDDSYYDIDHIYPRHYVKDDSIENNLVLVEQKLNRDKSDDLIGSDIRNRMLPVWRMLHEGGFINDEKYARLTRQKPFTDEEFAHFIERQIVETGQGTKETARILNEVLGNTDENNKVVYVKAKNVSEFRNDNKKYPQFVKSRVINDHHHAKDAYLNIVVGNTYFTKFTLNPENFIKESRTKSSTKGENAYNLSKMFARKVERNGYTAWDPDRDYETVKKTLEKNSVLVTRRSYIEHGQISDLTIVPAEKVKAVGGKGYIPIKKSVDKLSSPGGMGKYGGYTNAKGSYFFLVEHELKGKRIRTIEPVYVLMKDSIKTKEDLERYCRDELGLMAPSVRLERIPMYSHIRVDGFDYYLTGRSNERLFVCNAVQLTLPSEYIPYIKIITKGLDEKWDDEYIEAQEKRINDRSNHEEEYISKEKNMGLFRILIERHSKGIYSHRANGIGAVLTKGADAFEKLSMSEQIYVLNEILKISQVLNVGADLKQLGGAAKTGVTMISKSISRCDEFLLYQDSVTGIYSKSIDLLKV